MSNNKEFTDAASGSDEDKWVKIEKPDEDKNETLAAVPTKPESGKKKTGSPSKTTSMRTGEALQADGYNKDENDTAHCLLLPGPVLLAAHYIDRNFAPQRDIAEMFTARVLIFLLENWINRLPLTDQPWYRNLKLMKLERTEGPEDAGISDVAIEAARAVNRGVIPNEIMRVASRTLHGRKCLSAAQLKTVYEKRTANEQKQETSYSGYPYGPAIPSEGRASYIGYPYGPAIPSEGRASYSGYPNGPAIPSEDRASKKARKNHDDSHDDFKKKGGI